MSGFKMDDYVDVAERIRQFYERFPDGALTTGSAPRVVEIGGTPFIWYHAQAYRTPDDPLPGDGWAAEPVPGPTQFTKDSELMNAETAAWGRAIVALGFETKKIASAQEVRARQTTTRKKEKAFQPPAETGEMADTLQKTALRAVTDQLKADGKINQEQLDGAAGGKFDPDVLTKAQATDLLTRLETYAENVKDAA